MRDITEIAHYIAHDLQDPNAAQAIVDDIVAATEPLATLPHRNPLYSSWRTLKHEFRRFICGNYIDFYWVDEADQKVTIARVLYAHRDLDASLRKA